MSDYRTFVTDLEQLVEHLLAHHVRPESGLVPMVHLHRNDHTDGFVVKFDEGTPSIDVVVQSVVPLVQELAPLLVGWTFQSGQDAVVVAVDRERVEVWLAKLVRHGARYTLGPWNQLPPNEQAGALINPIQEALR